MITLCIRTTPGRIASVVILASLTFGVRSARADLIESAPYSLLGAASQETVNLPEFDPAQGALNSVTVTVSGSLQFALEVFDSGPGTVSITALDTLSFNGTPLPVGDVFTGTIPSGQPVYVFTTPAVSFGPVTEEFGPNAVSFFTGTGTIPFTLSLAPAVVSQFSGSSTNSVLAFPGASGTVTADFAFTPAASTAPEPASFAMAGLALICVGTFARRKRHSSRSK